MPVVTWQVKTPSCLYCTPTMNRLPAVDPEPCTAEDNDVHTSKTMSPELCTMEDNNVHGSMDPKPNSVHRSVDSKPFRLPWDCLKESFCTHTHAMHRWRWLCMCRCYHTFVSSLLAWCTDTVTPHTFAHNRTGSQFLLEFFSVLLA